MRLLRVDSVLSVGSMAESVEVTAAASVINTETAAEARFSKPKKLPLPSKLPLVTSARKDKVMLAADSAGTLFLSKNSGKSWKTVKPQWQGKVTHLTTSSDLFELRADPASVWLSRDGSHWYPGPQPPHK